MKNTMLALIAVASSVAVPFAQTAPSPAIPAHNVFVLTGCLMAETNPAATFKLTDVTADEKAPAVARAGEPGAVATSGQKVSYELLPVTGVAAQGLDANALNANAGHRVEVVVRPIESPAASVSNRGDAPPAKGPTVQRFTVTELKRVVGRCS